MIYEDADAAPTALVSPSSIVAGSFGIDYPAGQVVDEVVCSYIDPALDWQVSEVRRTRPGITTPATSTSITLRGVTDRTQAAKEANLAAARQTYHRRRLAWEPVPHRSNAEVVTSRASRSIRASPAMSSNTFQPAKRRARRRFRGEGG